MKSNDSQSYPARSRMTGIGRTMRFRLWRSFVTRRDGLCVSSVSCVGLMRYVHTCFPCLHCMVKLLWEREKGTNLWAEGNPPSPPSRGLLPPFSQGCLALSAAWRWSSNAAPFSWACLPGCNTRYKLKMLQCCCKAKVMDAVSAYEE
jgi:hypothetical protein